MRAVYRTCASAETARAWSSRYALPGVAGELEPDVRHAVRHRRPKSSTTPPAALVLPLLFLAGLHWTVRDGRAGGVRSVATPISLSVESRASVRRKVPARRRRSLVISVP